MKEILLDLIHNKTFIITLIIALTPFIIKIIGGILTKRTRSQEETINQDIVINYYKQFKNKNYELVN